MITPVQHHCSQAIAKDSTPYFNDKAALIYLYIMYIYVP